MTDSLDDFFLRQQQRIEQSVSTVHSRGKRKPSMDRQQDGKWTSWPSYDGCRRQDATFIGFERKWGRVKRYQPEATE